MRWYGLGYMRVDVEQYLAYYPQVCLLLAIRYCFALFWFLSPVADIFFFVENWVSRELSFLIFSLWVFDSQSFVFFYPKGFSLSNRLTLKTSHFNRQAQVVQIIGMWVNQENLQFSRLSSHNRHFFQFALFRWEIYYWDNFRNQNFLRSIKRVERFFLGPCD